MRRPGWTTLDPLALLDTTSQSGAIALRTVTRQGRKRRGHPLEIWHRRQVAACWNVGLSTLDRWVSRGHRQLPPPRFDPAGKPYWLADEVQAAAVAPEPGAERAPAPAAPT